MPKDLQYITNESGEKIGVFLDLKTYQQLTFNRQDPELLTNLSSEELLTLSETKLSVDAQAQLDDLLESNSRDQLLVSEQEHLDQLLTQLDNLNTLKTRAHYTLNHIATLAS